MDPSFQKSLEKYAELAVRVGLNIQPGQRLVIRAPVDTAPIIRLIAACAYQAGARLVDVQWRDDQVLLARFKYAPRDSFEEYPTWLTRALEEYARDGDASLYILAEDPDLLKDQDPALVATYERTHRRHMQPFLAYTMRNAVNWNIISVPIASWSAKVFPGLPPKEQEARLWEAIFKVCRVDQPDPVEAWKQHVNNLARRGRYLTEKQYAALHYTGPGTDLTIGLPEGHLWVSGQNNTASGIPFIANLPTEEVFTLPHMDQVEGFVSASRPLSHANTLIDGFSLSFEKGRVISATATRGEAVLRHLLDTDEGARRLGEVALLPQSSPIAASGLMFFNTLFDENAASHLALGKAYPFTLQGGDFLTKEEFAARGGNSSLTHVDFMIGSGQLNIDGLRRDGSTEPVMRMGEWAFDV